MSGRDTVLAKIRRSLGVTGEEAHRNATVDQRLRQAPRGVVPARGQLPHGEQVTLFRTMAEKAAATVTTVASAEAVPEAVADYLRGRNLPAALRMGDDPRLAAMNWGATQIEVGHGPSDGNDAVGLNHAFAGVAESGTLVLRSGKDNPTTLNFLPETEIVVIDAKDIAGDYESIWDRIRGSERGDDMPRTVNFITGPSRSGDIEQTIILGAHGPRALHIVIVG